MIQLLLLVLTLCHPLHADVLDHGYSLSNSEWKTFIKTDSKQRTMWGIDKVSKSKIFQAKIIESKEFSNASCNKLKELSIQNGQKIKSSQFLKTECFISLEDNNSNSIVLISQLDKTFQSYIFLRTYKKDRNLATFKGNHSVQESSIFSEMIKDAHTLQRSIQKNPL